MLTRRISTIIVSYSIFITILLFLVNIQVTSSQPPGFQSSSTSVQVRSAIYQLNSVFQHGSTTLRYDRIAYTEDDSSPLFRKSRSTKGDIVAGRSSFSAKRGTLFHVARLYANLAPRNPLIKFIPFLRAAWNAQSQTNRDQGWRELIKVLPKLQTAWKLSSLDPRFREAQDLITAQMYEDPAYTRADQITSGISSTAPLAKAIFFDSLVWQGDLAERDELTLENSLTRIIADANEYYPGLPSSSTSSVQQWLDLFLVSREGLVEREMGPRELSRKRVQTLAQLVETENFGLTVPFTVEYNGRNYTIDGVIKAYPDTAPFNMTTPTQAAARELSRPISRERKI